MKNNNIGIANLMVSNKWKNSYFNNNSIEESKKLTEDYFNIIKNSPILQLEFNTYNNIENKHIENELMASRYIDNCIKLFEVYTIDEINTEHEKLNKYITENVNIDENKSELYNAIDSLIKESLNDYSKINVDNIHESFVYVLNHIKKPKTILTESFNETILNEDVIEIAVDKFNKKYGNLNEDDKALLNKLIKYDETEKNNLLESYKTENLNLLESVNNDTVKENISKAINKIKEMKFDKDKINEDIISLHELKKDLI